MKTGITTALTVIALGLTGPAAHAGSAARQGDTTNHGGVITLGSPTVRIGGLPAARAGDAATCPIPLHIGGTIANGSPSVRINGASAARVGDLVTEVGSVSSIATGLATVQIGN